jgi:protein TonB
VSGDRKSKGTGCTWPAPRKSFEQFLKETGLPHPAKTMAYAAWQPPELESERQSAVPRPGKTLRMPPRRDVSLFLLPEQSLGSSLAKNLLDAIFPAHLPPLRLTSRPVRVAGELQFRRRPGSGVLAFLVHAGALWLLLWATLQMHNAPKVVAAKPVIVTTLTYQPYIPPTPPAPKAMGGGGGGGAHHLIEPSRGHIPIIRTQPIIPPQILVLDHPKLAAPAAVAMPQQVKLPNNTAMPNMGIPNSPQVAMASQGSGSGSGFGMGSGGGIGGGIGSGVGPGSGGGYGGGVMSVGGGVTAPQLIHSVEPEFTEQARSAHYTGVVSIGLIVDAQGNPQAIHVVHPLGMGLDQKAIEAVRQYKFRPAVFKGHAVAVQMVVEVEFRLF